MIKHVYLTEDKVSGLYSDPWVEPVDGEHVKASFIAAARAGKISEDAEFAVYEVGTYDDSEGKIMPFGKSIFVVKSSELAPYIKKAALKEVVADESLQTGE